MSVGGLRYPGVVAVGSVLVFCLALVGLAHSPAFLLSILFASLLGFCDSLQGVTRSTVIQSIVPDHLRGRVSSLQTMLVQGGPGFGQVWSGAMASVLGVAGAFTLGAGLAAALALGLIARYRELRSADLGQRVEPYSSAERLPVGPSTG
jgi:predicted MFS family arabinose efflux permease